MPSQTSVTVALSASTAGLSKATMKEVLFEAREVKAIEKPDKVPKRLLSKRRTDL
jgi:hypothetical protein